MIEFIDPPCPVMALVPLLAFARADEIENDERSGAEMAAGREDRAAFYTNARWHADDREDAVRSMIAASEATSLDGAAIQVAEALVWFERLHQGQDVEDGDFRAVERLLHSVLRVIRCHVGPSVEALLAEGFGHSHQDPWTPVEKRVAALFDEKAP